MSSVVIYLSNPPSSTAAATANVVVWVTAPTTTTGGGGSNISNNNNSNSHELSYYHYQDHSHLFSHTNALIQRLAPTTLVHVATSRISSSKQIPKGTPKQQQQQQKPPDPTVRRLLRVLEESLASISNTMVLSGEQPEESPDAPAPISSAVQFHDSYGSSNNNNNYSNSKMDPARLTSVVQQLWWTRNEPIGNVSSDNASTAPPTAPPTTTKTTANDPHSRGWLQWTGQVAWQQHPEIADALVFLLHTVNQWPCPKSNSNSNSWCIASITQGHLHSVLSLDSTAADAIHLWPPAIAAQQCVTGGRTATNSIYGVLSGACRTPLGQRRIHQWLRHPLVQIDAIVARQDAVAHFVAESMARDALRTVGLRPFATTDLSKLAATLAHYASSVVDDNNHAETTDATTHPNETTTTTAETSLRTPPTNARRALMALYDLYLVSSQKIPLLTEQLEMTVFVASTSSSEEDQEEDSPPQQSSGILSDILSTLQQCRTELERSVALIEAVLDLNQAPREFLVQADYKEELRDILEELDQGSADLEDCHARMNDLWAEVSGTASNNNNPTVRLESSSDDGCSAWQFRLPNTNDSKILQHQLADRVTVHKVLKNGVYFSTKELRHLSEKQQDLRAEYDRHQLAIVLDAASVAATYGPVLERASDAVSHLDALAALAHTAAYSPHGYCRPIMTDSDEDGCGIDLKAARHPCVELQDSVDFIPNDYKLIFGESSFLMVTGPNSESVGWHTDLGRPGDGFH